MLSGYLAGTGGLPTWQALEPPGASAYLAGAGEEDAMAAEMHEMREVFPVPQANEVPVLIARPGPVLLCTFQSR